MRWTALEGGGALPALLAASHARTTRDWLRATAGYDVPAQNMLVADRTGSIAIRSTGTYPIRPGNGRGDEIRDGATSKSDWHGFLGIGQYPTAADSPFGYLASANQEPIDPSAPASNQTVYLGANWEAPWRAMRINALLSADPAVTVDEMRRWQTDPASPRADYFVRVFLAAVGHEALRRSISADAQDAARLLGQWDRRYTRANTRAVLFEAAMHEVARRVWAALAPAQSDVPRAVPSSSVLAALLRDSTSDWWSQWERTRPVPSRAPRIGVMRTHGSGAASSQAMTRVGTRDSLLAASLAAAYDTVRRRYGPPDAGGWQWSRIQHANIYHLLRVPAFSRLDLPIAGGPETLNPSSGRGTQGSSWRMVVQLASDVHAWAVYPGGQSGNPSSSRYADRLKLWLSGSLDPVRFPRAATDLAPSDVRSILELRPRS
jgi:penicillin amidase